MIGSLREVYSHASSFIITSAGALALGYLLFAFTDIQQIYWNMGAQMAYLQAGVQGAIAVLFGINIATLMYKVKKSSLMGSRQAHTTALGSFISILVSGCPSCGITLASYLGMASVFTALPFHGLEVKIAGLSLLVYSTVSLLKAPSSCTIPLNRAAYP